jgi:hypothetical protein
MTRLLLLLSPVLLWTPAWGAYTYKATITLAQTTGSSDLTDRTNVVYISDATFKTAANGGHVQNTVTINTQVCPADLIFASDSGGATILSYACETYSSTTGTGYFHIKKTTSHSGTTTIYAFWGNAAVTTFQGGTFVSAFNSNILLAAFFNGISGGGSAATWYDYSVHALNGSTNTDYGGTSGVVDGYSYTYGSSQYFPGSGSLYDVTAGSLQVWVNAHSGVCSGGSGMTNFFALEDNIYVDNRIVLGCNDATGMISARAGNGGSDVQFNGTSTVPEGAWHNVGFSFANGQLSKFYVDGSPSGTFTPTIGTPTNSGLYVGMNCTNCAQNYIGGLDSLHFSSAQESDAWFAANYNNENAPATFAAVSDIGACSGACGAGGAATVTMTPFIM